MDDSARRPRRSLVVMVLDGMLGLATAVQTGNLPGLRRPAGRPVRSRRSGLLWLTAGVLVVAGGTTILIGALLRAPGGLAALPPPDRAAPAPAASSVAPAATGTRGTPPPSRSVSATVVPAASGPASAGVSATAPPSDPASAGGAHLTAAYAAAGGSGLLGYRATVTLAAQGPGPSTDWRLTITLPRSTLRVAAVSGATADQDGAVWTFTPADATRQVAAGTSVVIAFEVRGATLVDAQPTGCRVDEEPCTGLTA